MTEENDRERKGSHSPFPAPLPVLFGEYIMSGFFSMPVAQSRSSLSPSLPLSIFLSPSLYLPLALSLSFYLPLSLRRAQPDTRLNHQLFTAHAP
jgi:hypothetical protein